MTEQLDLGVIYCCCGCGQEAQQIEVIMGVPLPLPNVNPMTHYRNYKRKIELAKEQARQRLQISSPLESMTPEEFEQVRRKL